MARSGPRTGRSISIGRISATPSWGTMPVPASWQMHGFDVPIYTNIIYPWPQDPSKPPQVPYEFNPVGSYRMHFTVPPGWQGRRVILHFDGVDSAFYVWVNGKKLGLQRRQPHAGGVRHHAAPEGRLQPAGGGGLPLRRRRVSRRPGHVAHERHLPRRVPLVHTASSTCAISRCIPIWMTLIATALCGSTRP